MVHCNVSLGAIINGGGNFINCKPTFKKISCILFLKQANCAMDFAQKVVSFSFFIYVLLKCQIISHKFINPKDSRSAVWQHHRTKEHTLVQHLILCPGLKLRVQPLKILFPCLCDKQAALHTRPLLEITRGWGFKKCLSVFCPSKSHPLQKIIRHAFFFLYICVILRIRSILCAKGNVLCFWNS